MRSGVDVSVVIPVYNAGRFLFDCLDSLVGQTIDPERMEILLIDDGSTDGSAEVGDEYAKRYPGPFSVIRCEHTGCPGAARNKGMKLAQGEYVVFSDADDWWGKESIERLVTHAREWGSDMVQGRMCNVKNGHVEGMNKLFNAPKASVPDADWRTFQQLTSTLGSIRCFRRSVAIENDIWWDEDYWFEDLLFSLKLIFASRKNSLANDYNYYYVRRSDDNPSISTSQPKPLDIKRPENIVKSISKLFDLFDEQGASCVEGNFLLQKYFRHPVVLGAEIIEEHTRLCPERYPNGNKPFFDEIWERVEPYYAPCVQEGLSLEIRCAVDGLAAGIAQSELISLRRVATCGRKPKEIKRGGQEGASSISVVKELGFLRNETREELALRQLSNVVFGMVHRVELTESRLRLEGDVFFPLYGAYDIDAKAKLVGKNVEYALGEVELLPEVFGDAFQYKGAWNIDCDCLPPFAELAKEGDLSLVFDMAIGPLSRRVVYSKDKAEGCWQNSEKRSWSAGSYDLAFFKRQDGRWVFRCRSKRGSGVGSLPLLGSLFRKC